MKILIIISSLDIGGAENHLLNILPLLKSRGLELTVYSLKPGGVVGTRLKQRGIRVIEPGFGVVGPLRDFLLFIHIIVKLYVIRPDIIHFFLPKAYLIGGTASLFKPFIRRVMSRRSLNLYQKKRPVSKRIEHLLHKRMYRILGNSNAVLEDLRKEGVPKDRLGLIYNGVLFLQSDETRSGNKRKEWGIGDDVFIIIYVANLVEYKGHADLLHALSQARDNMPAEWRLICVGRDEGIKDQLAKLANSLDIAASVLFAGERSDIHELLSCSDLGVIASHQEGFSNSLLEKMSAGLPVIATDVGGNGEAIIDNESGVLVPPGAPALMAKAVLTLANDTSLRSRLGRNARERVRQHFSLEHCADQYFDLYTQR